MGRFFDKQRNFSYTVKLSIAGARAAGTAARCEARVVGAKFVRLDGPVAVDALTRDDLSDLKLEELLIVVPAVCFPFDAGSLASVYYVSVALRSAQGEEMPADLASIKISPAFLARLTESDAEDEAIVSFDSVGGSGQLDLLGLADLALQPDDWNIGILLRLVAFPAPAPRGDLGRIGFQLSVDGKIDRGR
ncbi:unnamed protein product, partial [Prorocentrum cordatum]